MRGLSAVSEFISSGVIIATFSRVIAPMLGGAPTARLPLVLRLLRRFAVLRRLPARLIGIGVRPEHVKSVAAPAALTGR